MTDLSAAEIQLNDSDGYLTGLDAQDFLLTRETVEPGDLFLYNRKVWRANCAGGYYKLERLTGDE